MDKDFFIKETVGAIKTYLRMINEESEELNGKEIIDNTWYYGIDGENGFQVTIKLNGQDKRIIFEESEWLGYGANMLGNEKLQQLHNELISS